jgi:hypothetical protein
MQANVGTKDQARTTSPPLTRAGDERPLKLIECPFEIHLTDDVAFSIARFRQFSGNSSFSEFHHELIGCWRCGNTAFAGHDMLREASAITTPPHAVTERVGGKVMLGSTK